jgi:acetylornithine deacetylase/succinyl-diaminopimelate desuccinylase-like protein
VTLHGPARDLHSGIFGGTVDNPAMALCQLLGKLRDKDGRVTVRLLSRGQPLSAYERKQFARLPFKARDYQALVGVPKLFGERGFTPVEQRSAGPPRDQRLPTVPGRRQQTIVPAWARAKITVRWCPIKTARS